MSESESGSFLAHIRPHLNGRYDTTLRQSLEIWVTPEATDEVAGDHVVIREPTVERLQIIADILAKNLVLDLYENKVSTTFDQIEPLARRLQSRWRRVWSIRILTNQIGQALLTEQRMVGRVEVKEKPEALWEHPELEGFYLRMFDEYELGDRSAALENKLDLITRTIETLLRLEEGRRSLRAEWYIILLIVVEIILILYDIF